MKASKYSLWLFILGILATSTLYTRAGSAQKPGAAFHPVIPRTWDDAPMAELAVPLADPIGSPKHVSADYYYKIPVRPIYKSYPVYAPGHEPPGYMDWLKQQEPEIVWGGEATTSRPPLRLKLIGLGRARPSLMRRLPTIWTQGSLPSKT